MTMSAGGPATKAAACGAPPFCPAVPVVPSRRAPLAGPLDDQGAIRSHAASLNIDRFFRLKTAPQKQS